MSSNLGPIRIKITSWEKYNYRKGVKNPSWFRFQHNFFESPHFYSLSTEEKMCWIYLLCQQSKMVDPTEAELPENSHQLSFPFEPTHFVRNTGLKVELMYQALLKLQKERLLEVIDDQHATLVIHARHTDVTRVLHECDTHVTYPCATEQNSTIQGIPEADASGPPTDSSKQNKSGKAKRVRAPKPPDPGLAHRQYLWELYSKCFEEKYRIKPTRGSFENLKIKEISEALKEEAEAVIIQFFKSNNKFYDQEKHHPRLVLTDCNKLRLELTRKDAARKQLFTNPDDLEGVLK